MNTQTKHCPSCKKHKLHSEYQVCKSKKDGLQTYCTSCQNSKNKSEQSIITRLYRSEIKNAKISSYKKVTYTKEQLTTWLYENGYKRMYEMYKNYNYDTDIIPSVDRIDSSKGYSLDNIQLIQWKFNRLKMTVDAYDKNKDSGIKKLGKYKISYQVTHQQDGQILTKSFKVKADADAWKLKCITSLRTLLKLNRIKIKEDK